ncbi:hypothetical protein M422DRAFT_252828 [Sphaerobolus stellatus SS14]|uniref:Uncharacterized protein n=1 Tax=Sphaerobolus stellatus (strain SS14) TaxID=990650 RepID=A0A0C9VY67_SPHS4|nr:hypothetical protein M422DRAFT_252828 [Sphaerobolus stellatus SS14]
MPSFNDLPRRIIFYIFAIYAEEADEWLQNRNLPGTQQTLEAAVLTAGGVLSAVCQDWKNIVLGNIWKRWFWKTFRIQAVHSTTQKQLELLEKHHCVDVTIVIFLKVETCAAYYELFTQMLLPYNARISSLVIYASRKAVPTVAHRVARLSRYYDRLILRPYEPHSYTSLLNDSSYIRQPRCRASADFARDAYNVFWRSPPHIIISELHFDETPVYWACEFLEVMGRRLDVKRMVVNTFALALSGHHDFFRTIHLGCNRIPICEFGSSFGPVDSRKDLRGYNDIFAPFADRVIFQGQEFSTREPGKMLKRISRDDSWPKMFWKSFGRAVAMMKTNSHRSITKCTKTEY